MIIYEREALSKVIEALKEEGLTIVTTNGCFDIIHLGHVEFLKQAKALGDVLVVGVNTDESVKALKGVERPINPLNLRMALLNALPIVDVVHPFNEQLPNAFLEAVKPHVHVKGGDYTPERLPEKVVVERYGGQVRVLPYKKGLSTTNVITTVIQRYGLEMVPCAHCDRRFDH
jgi:D-beta-D-heptose 7-phosphate kinase/D-beta-D-heptose 1-phosphate adenosyltransferase